MGVSLGLRLTPGTASQPSAGLDPGPSGCSLPWFPLRPWLPVWRPETLPHPRWALRRARPELQPKGARGLALLLPRGPATPPSWVPTAGDWELLCCGCACEQGAHPSGTRCPPGSEPGWVCERGSQRLPSTWLGAQAPRQEGVTKHQATLSGQAKACSHRWEAWVWAARRTHAGPRTSPNQTGLPQAPAPARPELPLTGRTTLPRGRPPRTALRGLLRSGRLTALPLGCLSCGLRTPGCKHLVPAVIHTHITQRLPLSSCGFRGS